MTDHERGALHQREVASLKEIIASQEGIIAQLTQHNRVLQLKVDALVKRLFGNSSEKLDPAQLEGSEAEQKDNAQPARKKKRSFAQLVASLPVEQVIVDPAEVVADPAAFVCIGSETTKLLDHVPA